MTDEEEPTSVQVLATCHTTGCSQDGITHQVTCYACAEPPTYRVWCIGCDTYITDLVLV
jgi:hypothetical protein